MSKPPNLRVNLNRFLEVIPLRRKAFSVADQPDYSSPRFLKPDFARIFNNKNVAKSNTAWLPSLSWRRLSVPLSRLSLGNRSHICFVCSVSAT